MRYDASASTFSPSGEYDLCIVGSGPSGISVCAELAESGLRIAVLESGSEQPSPFADSLRTVISEKLAVRGNSILRTVGGSTKTWDGLSAPLDPIDYLPRLSPYAKGWPISGAALEPYLKAASERYGFPDMRLYDAKAFHPGEGKTPPWHALEEKVFAGPRSPLRFGKAFRTLFDRAGIDLYTNATVTELRSAKDTGREGARRVFEVVCVNPQGKTFAISAKYFVLAAGAVENARILLNSRSTGDAGLGNEHDQVGRYLMNHPKAYAGRVRIRDGSLFERYAYAGDAGGYLGLRLSEDEQRRADMLNSSIRLEPYFPWTGRMELRALKTLLEQSRKAIIALLRRQWEKVHEHVRACGEPLRVVVVHIPQLLFLCAARIVYGRKPRPKEFSIRNFLEMEPRPENRVTLSDTTDAAGACVPSVHLELSERDIATLTHLHHTLARECEQLNVGSAVLPEPDFSGVTWMIPAHCLGTTRMGSDPKTSVVNADLRVHSVDNVYLAGGSVFPTSGSANPTFVMVALSIRLAEHLARIFSAKPLVLSAPHGAHGRGKGVIIIGSGGRVMEDIIPVFEQLEDVYDVQHICATNSRLVFGPRRTYRTQALSELTPEDIHNASLVYVAVSQREVGAVLSELARWDTAHLTLLIDTPTPLRHIHGVSANYSRMYIAEDSAYLPWIDTLARAAKNLRLTIRRVEFRNSAFRYHGVALIKAIDKALGGAGGITRGLRWGKRVYFVCTSGLRALVIEPRDYTRGTVRVVGEGDAGETSLAVEAMHQGGHCTGFSVKGVETRLSDVEEALIGPFHDGDTIVTHMRAIKRVGLYRMFRELQQGGRGWTLSDGENDMHIDLALRRIGVWFSLGGK